MFNGIDGKAQRCPQLFVLCPQRVTLCGEGPEGA
jgi:hypothetical protein